MKKKFSSREEAFQHIDKEHFQDSDSQTKNVDEMPNPSQRKIISKKRSMPETESIPLEQNPKKKFKRKKELDSLPEFEEDPALGRSRSSSSNISLTSKEYPDSGIDDTESINSDKKVRNIEDLRSEEDFQQIWNMEGDQTLVVGGRHIEKSRIRECSIILKRCDQKEQIIPKQERNTIRINNFAYPNSENYSKDNSLTESPEIIPDQSLAVQNDDIEEVPKIQQTNKKTVHEKTAIKITICDKEPKMSLTAKISKPSSQITLADIKNLILQRWQNFGKRTSPRVEDYTYSAKTIEDGEIEMQVIDEDSDDNDIVPSFHNGKEIKIEIICAL